MSHISKLFRNALVVALALVLIGALVFGGVALKASAAAGSTNVASNAADPVGSQDTSLNGPAGPGEVTYTEPTPSIIWSPSNAYLSADGSVTLHATLPDATVTTVSFDLRDAAVIEVTKAVAGTSGDPLTVAASGNTITLTSKNGAPLGEVVILTFHALANSTGGLIFAYANTTPATLSLPNGNGWSQFNRVNDDGTISRASVCYNYAVSDPTASSATMTVLANTVLVSVTSYGGTLDYTSTSSISGTTLTVGQIHGLGLNSFVNICLGAAADDKPFGVPAVVAPTVITVP